MIDRFSQLTTFVEDMWHQAAVDFSKQFKSVLPYTYSVSKDKKTASFEMALAGYSPKDIEVMYDNEGILSVKTINKPSPDESYDYVHKGIANRLFQFAVPVCSSYVIKEAVMKDGLLKIKFERLQNSNSKRIEVTSL